MKIIHEIDSLLDFEPWSYAVSRYETLTRQQLEQLDVLLEECYPDGMTDTEVNDILWHDCDWVAELLGFRNWEHLERTNNGEYEPIKIQCYDIDWDTDDEEVGYLPKSVLIELEDEDEIEEYYEHKENGDEDDFLSDKLSDEYDFCVNSFEYRVVEGDDLLEDLHLERSNNGEDDDLPCYAVRFDEDAQNLNETFEDKDEAMEYARDNISEGPVVYYIDEDGNEEVYSYLEEDDLLEDLMLEQKEQM